MNMAGRMISEKIISGQGEPSASGIPGVAQRIFASAECGATAMSTGTATFAPAGRLPYHARRCSEAVTVIDGDALFSVEGRTYHLRRFDCIHVPAGIAREVANASPSAPLVTLWAMASPHPVRDAVPSRFVTRDCSDMDPDPGDPEHILRFGGTPMYELAAETAFCDLFAGRFGSAGICGGYGRFQPGSSLPCHTHEFDESITIVEGEASCEVAGRRYRLSGCDTAFVPQGRPHRFLNETSRPMAMIWVYAGSEPSRTFVDAGYCNGSLIWRT